MRCHTWMDISSNVPYKVYTDFNGTLYTFMNEHLLKSPLQPCTEISTNDHSCMKTLVYIHRRYPDFRQMNGYLFLQIFLTKVYIHLIGTLDTYQWIFLHISPTKVVYIHRCYPDLRYMNAFSFKISLQRFISTHFIGSLDTYEWIMLYISLTYKGVYPNFIGTLVTRMNIYSNFLYSGHLTSWHWFFLFGRLLLKKCPYFDFLDYFDFFFGQRKVGYS